MDEVEASGVGKESETVKVTSRLTSVVSFLLEASRSARMFITPGKEGKGKHDRVGIVLEKFFRSTPEFERSLATKEKRRNGWTLTGSWPSSGKHIFDWEMEAWGESGGDVIVKTNIGDKNGKQEGISYRVTVANVDKSVERWLRKFFYPVKAKARREADAS